MRHSWCISFLFFVPACTIFIEAFRNGVRLIDASTIEQQTASIQGKDHLPELQAFRGLAALVVLFYHCILYYSYSDRLRHGLEHVLNAHAAVVSFYVLSGFVLSRSLSKSPMTFRTISGFYVRRLFRIYPALIAACCLGLAYIVLLHGHPLPAMVSGWWAHTYRDTNATKVQIIAAFLGIGSILPLNIWSVFVELIGSLLMPVIVFIRARGRLPVALLIAALAVISFCYGEQSRMGYGIYLIDFALGSAIPLLNGVFQRIARSKAGTQLAAIAFLVILFLVRNLGSWDFDKHYHSPAAANLEAVAAMFLIGLIAQRPESFSLLRHPWTVWLGDISYSVYLLQLPVMAFVAAIGGEMLKLSVFTSGPLSATIALLVCTLLVTLPLAAMSYLLIEIPGMTLGKSLARKVSAKTT
jgi:peptidoglycan/LPS O-acetylase OafA/YrhL